jgi:hypothetical protein
VFPYIKTIYTAILPAVFAPWITTHITTLISALTKTYKPADFSPIEMSYIPANFFALNAALETADFKSHLSALCSALEFSFVAAVQPTIAADYSPYQLSFESTFFAAFVPAYTKSCCAPYQSANATAVVEAI